MEIKPGMRVSLNKSKRSYYFQGENGINLRAGAEDSAIIPDDIKDMYLAMITKGVLMGHLVVGWPQEAKPNVKYKEDDSKILEKNVKKMVPFLEQIAKTPGKEDESPVARLEKLLKIEKEDKNRKTVIENIEKILDGLAGVSSVEESEKEEVKIDLI
jgi:hypothetical protein